MEGTTTPLADKGTRQFPQTRLVDNSPPNIKSFPQGLRLLDLTTLAYLSLLTAFILLFNSRVPSWYLYIAGHVTLFFVICLFLRFAGRHESGLWFVMREVYPMFLFTFMFKEVSMVINIFFPFWLENSLIHWDRLMFGDHAVLWVQRFFNPALTEIMAFSYWSYYVILPGAAIALLVSGKKDLLRSFLFSLTLTMCACYLSYLLLTARGPQDTIGHLLNGPTPTGFFFGMVLKIQAAASISGAAFPSSHVAAVWVVLIFMFKLNRTIGLLVMPIIVMLTISTVYLQYHYAVDAIAGMVLVGLTYPLGLMIERRFNKRRYLSPAYASSAPN